MFVVAKACEFDTLGFRSRDQFSRIEAREMISCFHQMKASYVGFRFYAEPIPQHQ